MLVAVMTKKLALNKGEKHVHFFMMDIQISKRVSTTVKMPLSFNSLLSFPTPVYLVISL